MKAITQILFPNPLGEDKSSILLLCLRIAFGAFIMYHGIDKIVHFGSMADHFPNPIGIGSKLSFCLVIFAEAFCSAALILGLLTRLSLIPMIFDFFVIVFVFSAHAPYGQRELPLVYFIALVILFFAGPGKFSIDYLIRRKLRERE